MPHTPPHSDAHDDASDPLTHENLTFLEQIEDPKVSQWVNQLQPIHYNFATLFPETQSRKPHRNAKRRVKLAHNVESIFPKLLYPGEHVRFITHGVLNSFVEQYFMGIIVAQRINRTVFVVTDYRILLINCDTKGKPRQMKWQIPFEELIKFKPGGMIGSTMFQARHDKKLKFSGVHTHDRKQLESIISERLNTVRDAGLAFPHYGGRDPLCPKCATPVPKKSTSCHECGDEFVLPRTPALLALLCPCLGEFYLAHHGIGLLELLGYGVTWIIVAGLFATGETQSIIVGILFLVAAHGFDALLTHHVAKKGLRSKSLAWKKP